MNSLQNELRAILNKYSAENGSNTPDFLLAQFLLGCLAAFDEATRQREEYYGRPLAIMPDDNQGSKP